MRSARILYVEDDLTLSFVTRDNLERAGYQVEYCDDGIVAYEKIKAGNFDLYILDVMLPGIDGFTLARKVREKDESAPILFLSARSTIDDKIYGLQIGADDYITKPFSIEELILKIEIFLRRSKVEVSRNHHDSIITLGTYQFMPEKLMLSNGNDTTSLTHKESELLLYLCKNMDTIVKRDAIMNSVWGNDQFYASRSLDVFISRLRKLLKQDSSIKIENIHNIGYRLSISEISE